MSALLNHPMHAYAIQDEIRLLTSNRQILTRSSAHNTLTNLENRQFIEEVTSHQYYWLNLRNGTAYELTKEGYKAIRRELSMYHEIFVKTRKWLEMIGGGQYQW